MEQHYLIFALQGQRCALPLSCVERVLPAVAITPLPRPAGHFLRGVINMHGDVVPVIDLRVPPPAPNANEEMILVALHDEKRAVLLADSVEGVRATSAGEIALSRTVLPSSHAETIQGPVAGGLIKDESGLIHLHDLDDVLSSATPESLSALWEAGVK